MRYGYRVTRRLRNFASCVANSEVGSAGDQCSRVKNHPTDAISSRRVFLGDVFHDLPKIVPSTGRKPERHEPRGLSSAAISSADTISPRFAWAKPSSIAAHSSSLG